MSQIQNIAAPSEQKRSNFGLKEEIRAYWSKRSETFDLSYGHKICTEAELAAWKDLVASHWRPGAGDRVLELASGTGEATRILLGLGCTVDAIDFCEPMIARAKAKHAGAPVRFHLGDAENTMMPDNCYDAVFCRHLVWTLLEPEKAFADWWRVLKPGGRLVIVDGDWVNETWLAKTLGRLTRFVDRLSGKPLLWDADANERIMRGVYFRDGLTASRLEQMLAEAGFQNIRCGDLKSVRRRQLEVASWSARIDLLAAYGSTFIMSAGKPD